MYRFSFTESVAGRAQEVSRQLFHEILAREDIKNTCMLIARQTDNNEIGRLKRSLPAFCWHAWFDEGKRKNYAAHASGMIMIDIDHVDHPRELYGTMATKAQALHLLVAHITPSTHGLRLVFPVPKGMDLVQAQTHYARELHVQVDGCTKDMARLSFCVPQDYMLYVDEEALFGDNPSGVAAEHPNTDVPPTGLPTTDQEEALPPKADEEQYGREGVYPDNYDGIDYRLIVDCLVEQLGGRPAHGSRNNFIFTMAAYLRYVCNDDPEWIASILPTFGEMREKWLRTISSACQRAQHSMMPQIMTRAIDQARQRQTARESGEEEQQLPPAMPQKLPRLMRHLLKNVPEVCRPAVAHAVFPALAAHLHGVKFWLIDGTEKEATFMCVTMARQSSGKSAVNKPIEYITADIVKRDAISRQREQEWKDASSNRSANMEKPKRPDDLCVQVLVSDMTNAAFVQRMKDAGDRYLYTNLEELELLRQLQTNGTKDVGKIICLCFDNGQYGQERVGTQSVTARVDLRWNWNAASTIQKGLNFFKGRLVDGTLSRINFCTIIPDKSKPFVYGAYNQKYAEELKPFIDNLNNATGHIRCKQALELAHQMQRQCEDDAALSDDATLEELTYRAVTIAYLKAMVLYIANGMVWSKDIAEFAMWSLEYDLWCKMHFFGQQIVEEEQHEKQVKHRGRQNLLDLLPNLFTLDNAREVRRAQGMSDEGCRQMINAWTCRGYIEPDTTIGVYLKTKDYLERSRRL